MESRSGDVSQGECSVSQTFKARIKFIHGDLRKKGMTQQGRDRKRRVTQKIWLQERETRLQLSAYMGILAILKEYVMVFQGSQTLVHKLHDRQLELFLTFLGCFVKAEHFTQLSPRALAELEIQEAMILSLRQLFVGQDTDTFRSQNPTHASTFVRSSANPHQLPACLGKRL
ncbi:hypothetical protein AALO_G00109150 [Alosa alosa]|uniref:Uncharacterized protein n=1 Tax=Alosa alosa TaxID=278164 RepID=A0AAV6GS07_9TELE|nr:hypothetical protein AALO_G00109150 [Alosa alosa]